MEKRKTCGEDKRFFKENLCAIALSLMAILQTRNILPLKHGETQEENEIHSRE